MKTAVADTSALIRLYVPDGPLPAGFESFVNSAWKAETILLAPSLALVESAQVLFRKQKRGHLSSEESEEIFTLLSNLPLIIVEVADLVPVAFNLARSHNTTVYDATFLALAKRHRAPLFTADRKLESVARKLNITDK